MKNTKYIIKAIGGPYDYYYKGNAEYPWTTEIEQAYKYDFMTMANMDAVVKMGMAPHEYVVVAV